MTTLLDACREVMSDPSLNMKYPRGLNSAEIMKEIRARHGDDAFPFCTVIDIADEMQAFYGKCR